MFVGLPIRFVALLHVYLPSDCEHNNCEHNNLLDRFVEYDADDIDHMTSELTNIIITAADSSLETKNTRNSGSFRSNTRQKYRYMKFDSH